MKKVLFSVIISMGVPAGIGGAGCAGFFGGVPMKIANN